MIHSKKNQKIQFQFDLNLLKLHHVNKFYMNYIILYELKIHNFWSFWILAFYFKADIYFNPNA